MARVDPEDDDVRRFIVRHYRYDPQRRERRHVVVGAFDNDPEFRTCMDGLQAEINRRRHSGGRVEPGEHVSGVVHEQGYRRRAANGRLLMRAIKRGAVGPWIDGLELPSNIAVFRAEGGPD